MGDNGLQCDITNQPVAWLKIGDCHQEYVEDNYVMWRNDSQWIYEVDDGNGIGNDNDNDGGDDDNENYHDDIDDDNEGDDDDDPVFLAVQGSARRGQFEERGGRRSSCVSYSDQDDFLCSHLQLQKGVILRCWSSSNAPLQQDVILQHFSPPSSTDCFFLTGFWPTSTTHIEVYTQR